MLEKLKIKLLKFLCIDELMKDLKYSLKEEFKDDIEFLERGLKIRINELDKRVRINRETLKNVVEISVDDRPYEGRHGHSWAVISVGGKLQYVKFVDLNHRYTTDIIQFLKQFEAGKHTIDTPYKKVFEEEMYYFEHDNKEG